MDPTYTGFYNINFQQGYNMINVSSFFVEKNTFFYMWADRTQHKISIDTSGQAPYTDVHMNWDETDYQRLDPNLNWNYLIRPILKYGYYMGSFQIEKNYTNPGVYALTAKVNNLILANVTVNVVSNTTSSLNSSMPFTNG